MEVVGSPLHAVMQARRERRPAANELATASVEREIRLSRCLATRSACTALPVTSTGARLLAEGSL